MVELSVEPKRKQQREHLLARMTGRRINTDNVVVVVAVTFLFSAVAETGAGAGVGTGMFVAENRERIRNQYQ